jgi:hypothetical protein
MIAESFFQNIFVEPLCMLIHCRKQFGHLKCPMINVVWKKTTNEHSLILNVKLYACVMVFLYFRMVILCDVF